MKSGGDANVMYRVQVGAYSKKENADNQVKKLKSDGFDTYLIQVDGLYKVQVGAYSVKTNAENMIAKLKEKGYGCFITTKGGQAVSEVSKKKSMEEIAKEIYHGQCSDSRWDT